MTRVDEAALVVRAPAQRVFAALLDREALESWLPPPGMSGRFEHFDARPGGSYRMVLTYQQSGQGKTTAGSDVVDVRFVDIESGARVVQAVDFDSADAAFRGTMTMTWTVTPVEDGAWVEVRAQDVPPGIAPEDHAAGLSSSLVNLAAYVEERGG
jgi:uncharacterized protein YndB with AHSA1/START domain